MRLLLGFVVCYHFVNYVYSLGGELVALEVKYQFSCLTEYKNSHWSSLRKKNSTSNTHIQNNKRSSFRRTMECITYIKYWRKNQRWVYIFKLKDMRKLCRHSTVSDQSFWRIWSSKVVRWKTEVTPCPSAPLKFVPVASPIDNFAKITSSVPNYASLPIKELCVYPRNKETLSPVVFGKIGRPPLKKSIFSMVLGLRTNSETWHWISY